jgi:hypothetical protein
VNGGMTNARKSSPPKKNEVRIKWLHLMTIMSWNTYIERRKQANKIYTQKKKNGLVIK